MTEPGNADDQERREDATAAETPDMGLRSHLRDLISSSRSLSTMLLVLIVLIVIGGGCALLLR